MEVLHEVTRSLAFRRISAACTVPSPAGILSATLCMVHTIGRLGPKRNRVA